MRNQVYLSILLLTFGSGCATAQSPAKISQLQIQVNQLENRLAERDKEIADLKFMVNNLSAQIDGDQDYSFHGPIEDFDIKPRSASDRSSSLTGKATDDSIIRVAVSAQNVQRALKSAGYYKGTIDGNIGSGSQKAIKDFQKEHNLKIDGIVGKGTWAELKNYLD